MYDKNDGTYRVGFKTYHSDLEEISSKHYKYTDSQALNDNSLSFCNSGYAIIKPIKYNGKDTWQLLKLITKSNISLFDDSEFISMARDSLGIPTNLNVTYKLGDEYYWDVGECYLRSISFYHNGEKVAGASFDPYSYDMVSDIYIYAIKY